MGSGRRSASNPPALKGLSEDLVLHRQHLYVANGVGLAVIDVSDESHPREVSSWDFPYRDGKPDIQQGWLEGVDLDGDTLYAALGPAGMATFDVLVPARPANLATIAPGTWGNEVVIEPQRKLLSFTGLEKFVLVDVTLPCYFYNSKFWWRGTDRSPTRKESTNYDFELEPIEIGPLEVHHVLLLVDADGCGWPDFGRRPRGLGPMCRRQRTPAEAGLRPALGTPEATPATGRITAIACTWPLLRWATKVMPYAPRAMPSPLRPTPRRGLPTAYTRCCARS